MADPASAEALKSPGDRPGATPPQSASSTASRESPASTSAAGPFRKKLAAEAVGTFCLVFAGTSAIVVNATGAVSHVGVALTFGLIVFVMIAALGDVSGAHLNPAVTVGFYLARRFPGRAVLPYILSQCAGAVLASLVVRLLFPADVSLGGTSPAGPVYQSWVLELLLTAGLMLVILCVSTGAAEKGITAGLAIGGVVALEALFAGPVCGASMNPARSLGPALVSWQLAAVWVYLTAPLAGAALAVPACRCVREAGCCSAATREAA
jgi:aquaporin Z